MAFDLTQKSDIMRDFSIVTRIQGNYTPRQMRLRANGLKATSKNYPKTTIYK